MFSREAKISPSGFGVNTPPETESSRVGATWRAYVSASMKSACSAPIAGGLQNTS
jgi:hypothetical protein